MLHLASSFLFSVTLPHPPSIEKSSLKNCNICHHYSILLIFSGLRVADSCYHLPPSATISYWNSPSHYRSDCSTSMNKQFHGAEQRVQVLFPFLNYPHHDNKGKYDDKHHICHLSSVTLNALKTNQIQEKMAE